MTQLKPTENIFAVEVPGDAFSFRIDGNGIEPLLTALLSELTENKAWNKIWSYSLPPGSYEILFTTSSATEQQAAELLPGQWSKYFENATGPKFKDFSDEIYRFDTALFSLISLLGANNLDPANKNYLLIKKTT